MATKFGGVSKSVYEHRLALGRMNLGNPREICLTLRSITAEALNLRNRPFIGFILNDHQIDIGPEHFGLKIEGALSREIILRCKHLAGKVKEFINCSLSPETRWIIFEAKFIAAGLDVHLQDFFGMEKPFFAAGGKLVDVEYLSDTIDYRFPRESNIPHFVYRILVGLPSGAGKTIYIKRTVPNRNEQIFAAACVLEGLPTFSPSGIKYYPFSEKEEWMITDEIGSQVTLKDVMTDKAKLTVRELESAFLSLASFSALSDAYARGARLLNNYPIAPTVEGRITTLDSEYLFNERDYTIPDASKGSHEIFFADAVPSFHCPDEIFKLLKAWEETYVKTWGEIRAKAQLHKQSIGHYSDKISPAAQAIFDRQLKADPFERLDAVFRAVLLWSVKKLYMDQWEKLASQHGFRIKNSDNDAGLQDVINILSASNLDRGNKLREISANDSLINNFFNLVADLSNKHLLSDDAADFLGRVQTLQAKQQDILKRIKETREQNAIDSLDQISDFNDLLTFVGNMPLSPSIVDRLTDKLIGISLRGGQIDLGVFTQYLILIINSASPALRKALRQSSKVANALFGIQSVEASSIFFDHKTLVLKATLDKHVQEGVTLLEIGPGCMATLSVYLAKHKGAKVVAAEINRDFIRTGTNSARINGVELEILESDIASNIEGEYDLVFWNIPFVTSNPRHLDSIAPGLFDELKGYATEADDGTNLIRRFLDEVPRILSIRGKAIFASNTFYVPQDKILAIIEGSKFNLVEIVTQENNTSVAFVLELK